MDRRLKIKVYFMRRDYIVLSCMSKQFRPYIQLYHLYMFIVYVRSQYHLEVQAVKHLAILTHGLRFDKVNQSSFATHYCLLTVNNFFLMSANLCRGKFHRREDIYTSVVISILVIGTIYNLRRLLLKEWVTTFKALIWPLASGR